MIAFRPIILSATVLFLAALLLSAQVPRQGVIDMDGQSWPPADPREKAEWTFARMRYELGYQYGRFGFLRWAADYPKADRQFVRGVKRLTAWKPVPPNRSSISIATTSITGPGSTSKTAEGGASRHPRRRASANISSAAVS
jgi:hypothetical protein